MPTDQCHSEFKLVHFIPGKLNPLFGRERFLHPMAPHAWPNYASTRSPLICFYWLLFFKASEECAKNFSFSQVVWYNLLFTKSKLKYKRRKSHRVLQSYAMMEVFDQHKEAASSFVWLISSILDHANSLCHSHTLSCICRVLKQNRCSYESHKTFVIYS